MVWGPFGSGRGVDGSVRRDVIQPSIGWVERESDKYKLVQLRAGNSLIDLMEVTVPDDREVPDSESSTAHNMDHFCVQISPWDDNALQNHLNLHNVKFGKIGRRYGALGEVPALYLSDPEGNTVELMGPPDRE